jgi:uncharacterized protein
VTTSRGPLWTLGAPVRWALLGLIVAYRVTLSGWLGGQCRFSPSCSHYAQDAIRTHGAVRGAYLSTRRLLRCNPFHPGGLDPVPPSSYDTAIQSGQVEGRRAG